MPGIKIVVTGGSYSAGAVFNYLEKLQTIFRESVDLIFVSDRKFFVYDEILLHYLSNSASLNEAGQWIREIVFLRPGISFIESTVLNINFENKDIYTEKGVIKYDYLVLAPHNDSEGELNFDCSEKPFSANSPAHIFKLKNSIIENLEKAVHERDLEIKNSLLSFSIIGGNKFGIELAFSFRDFIDRIIKKSYPELKSSSVRINLIGEDNVDSLNKDPFFKSKIFFYLNKKRIVTYNNTKIQKIKGNKILFDDNNEILSSLMVVNNPNRCSSLLELLKKMHGRDFLPNVNFYMQAEKHENVFIIGEFANCLDLTEDTPKGLLFYKKQAKICAQNICAKINNTSMKLLKDDFKIDFMSIGYLNSLFEIRNVYLDGIVGWLIQRAFLVYLSLGPIKKLKVLAGMFSGLFGLNQIELIDIYEFDFSKQSLKK